MAKTSQNILFTLLVLVLTGTATHRAAAAVKAFFLFQSSATETVPDSFATNCIVTLTYSNASGTINNAVFTNGVSITPSGQGVTVNLNQFSPAIADNGGTGTLPLTISAPANTTPNTTYQIIVSATNNSFTANVPSGIASLTNTFIVSGSAYSNGFSMALSPTAATCLGGTATNFTSTVTLVDDSSTLSGTVTNGITVSPSGQGVTAGLNSIYAPITNNLGQTNLTLTINVTADAAPGAYTVTVSGTNSAFTANSPIPGVASVIFTLNLTALNEFTMSSVTPAAETVVGGVASKVIATVTLTNLSTILVEAITNSVTVIGPDTIKVTAGLSSVYVSPSAGGGTAALTLSITNNGSSLPGTYQVIVSSTNNDFTDNSPIPGIALATNLFTVNAPPLSIHNFSLSGGNLTFTGIGGGPDGQYVVYSATNLALPLAQWTPVMTNMFDASGNFNALIALANTPNPNAARQFFTTLFVTGTNPVATPTFSPAAGPFFAETPVTITTATSNAIIRYTTDGSTPSESNGVFYTGPVTMQMPVNTNQSGVVSNASGVTRLKAIAYKGGMPDSAVWAGIYEILDQVDYPPASSPSPLVGVAHMAYNVSSSNWNNILNLWTNGFGLAPMMVSNNFALIKINDQQFVELYQVPFLVSNQWQLANYGFQVTNAELYRQQLYNNGVSVPAGVTTNALGNLSFFTVDPDGHTNEWVQYLTNSITGLSQGQYISSTALVGFANDFGICTIYGTNDVISAPPINYYVTQCGFQGGEGGGNTLYFPSGGKRYLELLTAGAGGATQATAGKHGKLQFMNFRGMTVNQTMNIFTNRNTSVVATNIFAPEGSTNSVLHMAFDVYDLDLSRIRINDY